jgi:hypothetical protein
MAGLAVGVVDPAASRLLLVAHAVVGAVLVAATTHLVVWAYPYLRGQVARHRGVRIFATVALAAYLVQFVLGNLLYPAYVVRVRGLLGPRAGVASDLSWASRLFEIKEHWAALGIPLVAGAAIFSSLRQTGVRAPRSGRAVFLCAAGAAVCAWSAALIGLLVTAIGSVGSAP